MTPWIKANKAFIGKWIDDKDGHITVIQLPNLPLLVYIGASILTRIFASGLPNYLFKVVAFGSIFTWAWLEILRGVNYFRRVLGLVVLGLSIMSAVGFLQSLK
jgi:hypothetical protein